MLTRFLTLYRKGTASFIFCLMVSGSSLFAQKNSSPVDSFHYYIRHVHSHDELTPLPEDHPDYKEPEAELTLVIYIHAPEKMESLSVDLGKQKDLGDIRKWKFDILEKEGKLFLRKGEKNYPVTNGKVIISEKVPADIYTKKMHLEIHTLDKRGKESNKKRKEFH